MKWAENQTNLIMQGLKQAKHTAGLPPKQLALPWILHLLLPELSVWHFRQQDTNLYTSRSHVVLPHNKTFKIFCFHEKALDRNIELLSTKYPCQSCICSDCQKEEPFYEEHGQDQVIPLNSPVQNQHTWLVLRPGSLEEGRGTHKRPGQ